MSQQINLFNPIFLKEKKHFSALAMVQALGVVLLGVVAIFLFSEYRTVTLSRQANTVTEQLARAQQQQATLNAQYVGRKNNKTLEDEVKSAQAELAMMQQAVARLKNDQFGDKKGYSAYLRAFARQRIDGLWLTGFDIQGAGAEIGIKGRALTPELIPAYMSRLGQETVLQGKSFAALDMREPKPVEQKVPPSSSASATAEQKKVEPPAFIEFSLRSAGLEKSAGTDGKPAAASAVATGAKAK